ncbi:hypothetical protein ABPG75_009189 [Micractinium tetrahymenae]
MDTLLASGAAVDARDRYGFTPLCQAAWKGQEDSVERLLGAGASPSAANKEGQTAAHLAAKEGDGACLRLLLAAQPEAALLRDNTGHTQLDVSLKNWTKPYGTRNEAAAFLLREAVLPPVDDVLDLLNEQGEWYEADGEFESLYAMLAARQPLTADQWEQVPNSCFDLVTALPAVLERCAAEAALLVRHLPEDERSCLRTVALCLARVPRQLRLPPLPTPIMRRLLALVAAD